jgi:23S rRNA (cytidine2498-2'-O)-methyltransferase
VVRATGEDTKTPAIAEPIGGQVHLAAAGFEDELAAELGPQATRFAPAGRLFHAPAAPLHPPAWAVTTWLDPVRLRFGSISEAAAALLRLGHRWALCATTLHRRAALIAANLPRLSFPPLVFPSPPPASPWPALGAWTLVAPDEIIASARCTSPFPDGEVQFVEDHVRPPSRAYLKLWEAFTVAGRHPRPGDRCVDLGSSPGGWTWALERLGARVTSVDKAPIDARLTKLTRVRYVQDSAFAIDPRKVGRVDWLVSDVICYPKRALSLVERWLAAHPAASFVVTIKLQGEGDPAPLRDLAAIEGARLVHLSHNKHELTWIRLGPAPD